jgi:hypothetical protein
VRDSPLKIDPVDAYGNPTTTPVAVHIYLPGYPGWRGFSYNYAATVRIQPTAGPTWPGATGAKRFFQSAEGTVVVEHAFDVFPINRWKSLRLVISYKFGGLAFREHATFLNLKNGQQIVIATGRREKDFESIAARADDIVRRWDKVQPGDELGTN